MSELTGLAGLFTGIGVLLLCSVLTYMFYQITRSLKNEADTLEREEIIVQCAYDKYAATKDIDIDKELEKRKLFKEISFRKQLRKQIREEFFKEFNKKK